MIIKIISALLLVGFFMNALLFDLTKHATSNAKVMGINKIVYNLYTFVQLRVQDFSASLHSHK